MNKTKKVTAKKKKIDPEKLMEEIRKRAHEISLKRERGNKEGDALSDWLQAEREIKKKYNVA
jgi:hypothetical protein